MKAQQDLRDAAVLLGRECRLVGLREEEIAARIGRSTTTVRRVLSGRATSAPTLALIDQALRSHRRGQAQTTLPL